MKKYLLLTSITLILAACGGENSETADTNANTGSDIAEKTTSANVMYGEDPSNEELEAQRFDANWRSSDSIANRNRPTEPRSGQYAELAGKLKFTPRSESASSADELGAGGVFSANVDSLVVPVKGDVRGRSVLAAQILLASANFSPGIIDGRWGKNSSTATWWFQDQYGLEPTGEVDEPTFRKLVEVSGNINALQKYSVTTSDTEVELTEIPEDPYEKAELDCLCYESVGEALAEKFHTSVEFLERINKVNLESVATGDSLWVPNVGRGTNPPVNQVIISVDGQYIHGENENGEITFHAPVTVGSQYDPSPSERLKITGIAHDPTFHYNPKLYHEVDDSEPDAVLQPGPNSPVGVVWIALDKDHYGIHGTAAPSTIGYASSHGCIRLTNWDVEELTKSVSQGTPVHFVDTRG